MKKILITGIALFALIFSTQTKAQISAGLSINIGSQPGWGPTGYDYVDYYYLPDIDAYYNVPNHQYTYLNGGRWITSSILPAVYASFDFYNAYKVVLNGVKRPWLRGSGSYYRTKYASYKGRTGQQFIYRNSDKKYSNYYKGNSKNQPRPPQNYNPSPSRPGQGQPRPGGQPNRPNGGGRR